MDRELQRGWSDFKPVAHIAAAILTIYEASERAEKGLRDFLHRHIWDVVATDKGFQAFGLSFQEKRSRSRLLDANETFAHPECLGVGLGTAFEAPPLGDHLLNLARQYTVRT